jgi:hypothetical protein
MMNSDKITGSIENQVEISGTMTINVPVVGTVAVGGSASAKDAVLYTEQELTIDQQKQARSNIGVAGEDVSGTIQTPFDPNEAGGFAYIYEDPKEAAAGAEIFNSYSGDADGTGVENYDRNIAIGFMSQASGFRTQAIGNYSKAEGWWTRADGQCAVASGLLSRASGHFSHAEGTRTLASINNAHAEGDMTKATGRQSHSEGQSTTSSGFCSHAEGSATVSSGYYSHSEGWGTIAAGKNQTAMGKYNVKDTTSLLIIGRGTNDSTRKNAHTVDASGNGWFAGDVYIKSSGGVNKDSGSKKLATEEYVSTYINNNIAQLILANLPIYEGEVETV